MNAMEQYQRICICFPNVACTASLQGDVILGIMQSDSFVSCTVVMLRRCGLVVVFGLRSVTKSAVVCQYRYLHVMASTCLTVPPFSDQMLFITRTGDIRIQYCPNIGP